MASYLDKVRQEYTQVLIGHIPLSFVHFREVDKTKVYLDPKLGGHLVGELKTKDIPEFCDAVKGLTLTYFHTKKKGK